MPNCKDKVGEAWVADDAYHGGGLASAGGSSTAAGTAVDMGRSAVSCESGEVVGRSAMNESGRAEEVTQPTVAEAAAGVGILVGDTQLNSEQTVCTAGCV